jgi:gliding motility-associated-like protein
MSLSIYNFTKDTQFAVIKTLNGYQLALRISAIEDGVKNVVSWSNQIMVDFNPIVWIPNVFTPQNGDNLNNTFHVFAANYKSYQIDIYNRWGEHIFRSNDPNVQWDGSFKGSICDEGVYLYQVVVHGSKTDIFRNGTLNLMR